MQVDYTLAQQLLNDSNAALTPAMLHGALSGYLCSGAEPQADIFPDLFDTTIPPVVSQLLERLAEETGRQFRAEDFSFQLLLPGETHSLTDRLEALRCWCDWFNIGFAAGFMRPQSEIGPELMEILNDFGQLANVDPLEGEVGEDDEADFMELNEYVRMAALTLFLQFNAGTRSSEGDESDPEEQLFADPDEPLH